ncbi:hypothetical protein IFM89_030196 [Coptis chinensis]|uniref:Uncharacterized protein n=1 Tax=Coptis chinensis TaxID=261450 RepID=A0A835LPG4_9MAGN|nr:hypothetical protein IFM89_030196 [Coptis chinensis]
MMRTSLEKILEIEYIKAVVPRKQDDPCLHDDWVSAVNGSNPRVWKSNGLCTHVLEGHKDAIISVSLVNSKDQEDEGIEAEEGPSNGNSSEWWNYYSLWLCSYLGFYRDFGLRKNWAQLTWIGLCLGIQSVGLESRKALGRIRKGVGPESKPGNTPKVGLKQFCIHKDKFNDV